MKTYLSTFHEIACNSLMPENCHNYFNHIYPHKKSISNFIHNGIIPIADNTIPDIHKNIIEIKKYIYQMPMISSEVKNDWDHFASLKIPKSHFQLVNIFSPYFSFTPKISFYAILIGYGTAAAMYSILLQLKRISSKNRRKLFRYHIIHTIRRILTEKVPVNGEDFDNDTESSVFDSPSESSIIIRNLNKLGVLLIYLELVKRYPLSKYPELLIPKEVWYGIYPGILGELKEIPGRKIFIEQIHRLISPEFTRIASPKSTGKVLPDSPATRFINPEPATGNTSEVSTGKEPDLSANNRDPSQQSNGYKVYLSATDVMQLLGVNKQTLKRYRDTYDLPFEPLNSHKFVYPQEKIKKWMEEHPSLVKKQPHQEVLNQPSKTSSTP